VGVFDVSIEERKILSHQKGAPLMQTN